MKRRRTAEDNQFIAATHWLQVPRWNRFRERLNSRAVREVRISEADITASQSYAATGRTREAIRLRDERPVLAI